MHCALGIEEILLNIFGHSASDCSADLASLARTCCTFKEPVLDILWEELKDLSPLALCLPEACRKQLLLEEWPESIQYSICRSLTQVEWDILRSYTRRIRSLHIEDIYGLSQKTILRLSTTLKPHFPNLRHLDLDYNSGRANLLLLPLPSLISLNVTLYKSRLFRKALKSVVRTSPNLRKLSIGLGPYSSINVYPSFIYHWKNLECVALYGIFLDVNTLLHVSRMPALTKLVFGLRTALPDQIPPSDLPLIFRDLSDLCLQCEFLHPISTLLSQARLPALTKFYGVIKTCPSQSYFTSFLISIQTSCANHTIQELLISQEFSFEDKRVPWDSRTILRFGDLQLCMAFGNLRRMEIDIEWKVDLTDGQLLTLASAWPRLENLSINKEWGWATQGGVTPTGLLQLLRACRSLYKIALAIDTRGYTTLPPTSTFLGLTFPYLYINLIDSFIEAESVPVIATFFSGIASHSDLWLRSNWSYGMVGSPYWHMCKARWEDVVERVEDTIRHQRSSGSHKDGSGISV